MAENVLEHEEAVLFIVQEYLNKNRYFTLEDVVPFIHVRLKKFSEGINYAGIKEILKSLIKKNLIFERSKFVRDEILENDNRKKIYDFICQNPGVYFNNIATKLHLSNYILAWHIKTLKNFNYIRIKQVENHEVYFNAALKDEDNDAMLSFIFKSKSKKIIEYLMINQEGASKTQLAKELNMHSTTISKYVDELDKFGVLLKKKLPNMTLYFLNERYYYEIVRR